MDMYYFLNVKEKVKERIRDKLKVIYKKEEKREFVKLTNH